MAERVAAIVLAAGASRRLGRPKALVRIDGEALVRRAAAAALGAGCAPLFVVAGELEPEIRRELGALAATIVRNPDAAEGIASSIRAGAAAAAAATPACDGVLLLLVDQLRVDAELLRRLLARFSEGRARRIAACAYAGGLGAPAVFPRSRLAALATLRGDRGAKAVIEAERASVLELPFPEGAIDLDTPEDLARAGLTP